MATFYLTFKKVHISQYHFITPSRKSGYSFVRPKSWKIEASNDKNEWELIELKEDDSSLNEYNRFILFTCNNIISESYHRYIRIKEIQSHTNDHRFILTEIEFCGSFE